MNYWKNKRVVVTGGAGFIGSHVTEKLVGMGANVTVLDDFSNGNLSNLDSVIKKIRVIKGDVTQESICDKVFSNQDIVLNLAAKVGGIEYNQKHQADMLHHNLLLEMVPLKAAQKTGVKRFLVVSSACVYPHNASIPTPESEGFLGEPEPTNSGYGWAKRMGELAGSLYHKQYNMDVGIVRPYNCYGPRDHFEEERSHVIPALIKRVINGENPVVVWGSGSQTRSFLYVDDLAAGIILAAEKLSHPTPVNLGSDEEVNMKDLVNLIIKIADVNSQIKFDTAKPDGSPRRVSDNRLAEKLFGFKPEVTLEEGLGKTIQWYNKNSKGKNV